MMATSTVPLVDGSSGPTTWRPLAALAVPLAALDVPDAPRLLPEVAAGLLPDTAGDSGGRGRRRIGGRGLEGRFQIDAGERLREQRFLLVQPEELLGRLGDQPFGLLEPLVLDRVVDLAQRVPELDLFLVQPRRRLRRPDGVEARAQLAVLDEGAGDERRRLRLEVGPALAVVGHDARKDRGLDLVLALFGALAELIDLGLLLPQLDQRFENRDIDGGAVSRHRSHTSS